jgi:hypothetical protein
LRLELSGQGDVIIESDDHNNNNNKTVMEKEGK